MNILFVSEYFWPRAAGGEVWSWELCKELTKEHEVTVMTLRHDNSPGEETKDGVRIIRLHKAQKNLFMRQYSASRLLRSVKAHIRQEKPDVIHVMAYLMSIPISRLAKRKGIPCVTSVHSFFGDEWRRISKIWPLMQVLESHALRKDRSAVMHVPSQYMHDRVAEQTGRESRVIHNWAPDHFPEPKKFSEETYLFVGSLEPVKNPLACVIAAKKRKLIVIGTGSMEKQMKQMCSDCTFIKNSTREETLAHVGGANLVLVPSLTESFSLVALEAMAQGTPVSGTPVGIIPELPAVPFPPKETPQRLTADHVKEIRKRFSKSSIIKKFTTLYTELTDKRSE